MVETEELKVLKQAAAEKKALHESLTQAHARIVALEHVVRVQAQKLEHEGKAGEATMLLLSAGMELPGAGAGAGGGAARSEHRSRRR